jgi:hypothetical protein
MSDCTCLVKYFLLKFGIRLNAGNSFWRGRLSTVDFLELTILDQLIVLLKKIIYPFKKTSYPNEDVNHTQPSPLVRVPCLICHRWVGEAHLSSSNLRLEIDYGDAW